MVRRRDLLSLTPAAAAIVVSEMDLAAQPPQPQTPASPAFTREQLRQALAFYGLDSFKDEQLDMMLTNMGRNVTAYANLRKIQVPLDTDPAFTFNPLYAGKSMPAAGRFRPSKPPRGLDKQKFNNIEELAFWPVTHLAELVRRKKVTSTDLTKMYLERLKKHSPTLLCTITLTEPLALEQAKRADTEIRRGRYKGPLHGIPYGAKDLFATKGYKTTFGAEPYQEQVIDANATVIEKLENAGAVLLAKLSMGALAQGGLWFGGMTKTPWNTEVTSSGSSAGSASATSAGLVAFSLGTETLGSIISPSTRCGVSGLRPTFGRVSRAGAMALCWTMDKIGPICRTIEDCMLVLREIQGADGKDLSVHAGAPLQWDPQIPLSKLRIGYLKADFDRRPQGAGGAAAQPGNPNAAVERRKLYEDALETLRKAGAKLEEFTLPEMSTPFISVILNAESAAAFDDLTRDGGVEKLSGQRPFDWPNSFRSARMIPAVEYIRSMRARTLLMHEFDKLMSPWDVLVSPNFSPILSVTNITGHPQMCVPCGLVGGNDPISLMFTGRLFEEGAPARVAKAFQDATDWHRRQPPLFKVTP
jgi:Asp-tRNA(Asn)/Glu-tRNA(Gln) amidotransferase A subunit family amidase